MSITPIRHSIEVSGDPERAFALFTARIGEWWPLERTPAETRAVNVIIEPKVGGRWYEVDGAGKETPWGTVVSYDPPGSLILGWKLGRDFKYEEALLTEVEIRFTAMAGGRTRVELEHRDLERFGDYAEQRRAQVDGGWAERLGDFAGYVSHQESEVES